MSIGGILEKEVAHLFGNLNTTHTHNKCIGAEIDWDAFTSEGARPRIDHSEHSFANIDTGPHLKTERRRPK